MEKSQLLFGDNYFLAGYCFAKVRVLPAYVFRLSVA